MAATPAHKPSNDGGDGFAGNRYGVSPEAAADSGPRKPPPGKSQPRPAPAPPVGTVLLGSSLKELLDRDASEATQSGRKGAKGGKAR